VPSGYNLDAVSQVTGRDRTHMRLRQQLALKLIAREQLAYIGEKKFVACNTDPMIPNQLRTVELVKTNPILKAYFSQDEKQALHNKVYGSNKV
jgi:hypothetical protein